MTSRTPPIMTSHTHPIHTATRAAQDAANASSHLTSHAADGAAEDDVMDRFTRPSHWATNAHITDIKQNSTQWNKDREKCIAGIAKASEVFNVLGKLWLRVPPNKRVRTVHHMQELVLHRQVPTAGGELKDMMQKGDFDTIWLLLEESERKRHLLAGIEGTCGRAFLGNIVALYVPKLPRPIS
ncbi:hypothetical protein SCP_0104710 [Sparassis crispa]|uniref:Uncharacterized protein n=1 Tax=Sparassis crispa TaxID=139825 RepID=A0A401G5Z7_9APHY|nr:hypothetical protein SCP_0104710 [Sparassis crispa]GBE77591.1 hypothetical protein SCP_0104710 [Sparassis crispa]